MAKRVESAVAAACPGCAAAQEGRALFCAQCGRIQPPPGCDYFTVFGLRPHLNLDAAALEREFHGLSRRLHPDRFIRAGAQEKEWSLADTALVNDAYRTLKDPLRRTEYVLKLSGTWGGPGKEKTPADLLEEVFELNMEVDEARAAKQAGKDERAQRTGLEAARARVAEMVEGLDRELRAQWPAWDAGAEDTRRSAERAMALLVERRRYLSNLVREVDEILGE